MTWLKKDDGFPKHRKIRRLPDSAYRLHDTALCYAAHDETDGLIRPEDIDEMQHGSRLRRHIPALVEAGLWDVVPEGWMLHDFLNYNPSHIQLEAERSAARDRQARARAKRRGVSEESSEGGSHAVTHAVTNGDVTRESHHESRPPVPDRTEPFRTEPFRPALEVLRSVGDGDQESNRHLGDGPGLASVDAWKSVNDA